jgi:hypothetical protein
MKVGDHLAVLIKWWLRLRSSGCGSCQATLDYMNQLGPAGCRQHLGHLVVQIRTNARKNKHWRARILARLPGAKRPIKAMVMHAILLAEADEQKAKEEAAK